METKEKIRAYIMANMSSFEDDITIDDSDNIFKMGFVNSLFAMKLLSFVEAEFKIEVDKHEINIENFSSINNIAALIEKKNVQLQQ